MTKKTDISIQFYATVQEQREFIQAVLNSRTTFGTKIDQNPFRMFELNEANLTETIDGTTPCRIYFTKEKPKTGSSKEMYEIEASGPLILDVGHLSTVGLHSSWLACRCFDEEVLKEWRNVAKMLKRQTMEGITATSRTNGISQYYKSFRHTSGARKLQHDGGVMIPPQGEKGPLIRLVDGIP